MHPDHGGLKLSVPKNIVTHNGTFHSDDVYGVAMLKLLRDDIIVTRTREDTVIKLSDLAFDVGMIYDPENLRFDHHQNDAPVRPNGIKYCGFGQMWQFFGLELCQNNTEVWQRIDERFVQLIDAEDNGVTLFTRADDCHDYKNLRTYDISTIVSDFNPPKDAVNPPTMDDFDQRFDLAVNHAMVILQNLVNTELSKSKNRVLAKKALDERPRREFIVFDNLVPLGDLADEYPELLYSAAYNKAADNWKVTAIHDSDKPFTNRLSFPKNWGGLRDEELQKVTGIKTASFCHSACFLFVAKTKEDAVRAIELSLEQLQ